MAALSARDWMAEQAAGDPDRPEIDVECSCIMEKDEAEQAEQAEQVRLHADVRRGVPADAIWFGSALPHESLRSLSWILSLPLAPAQPPVIDS